MASRNFRGVSQNMVEMAFNGVLNHVYEGKQIGELQTQALRQFFFAGADQIAGHLIFLANNGLQKELIHFITNLELELEKFKKEQLTIIEQQVTLNG